MFTLKFTKDGKPTEVGELKTESRALGRALKILARENGLDVVATEEVAPREVKFKGVD